METESKSESFTSPVTQFQHVVEIIQLIQLSQATDDPVMEEMFPWLLCPHRNGAVAHQFYRQMKGMLVGRSVTNLLNEEHASPPHVPNAEAIEIGYVL
jgi:hypothetical protein